MDSMKKTHPKSFMVVAEMGSAVQERLTIIKPYVISSDNTKVEVVVLQLQVTNGIRKDLIVAEVVLKKDFEDY